jgi:hypothetical protein
MIQIQQWQLCITISDDIQINPNSFCTDTNESDPQDGILDQVVMNPSAVVKTARFFEKRLNKR